MAAGGWADSGLPVRTCGQMVTGIAFALTAIGVLMIYSASTFWGVEKFGDPAHFMKRQLQEFGFDTGDSDSPVIPIIVGDDVTTFTMAKRLQEEGVFANPVVTPAVPPGQAMIRTSYMATHKREHLDRALAALKKVGRQLDLI